MEHQSPFNQPKSLGQFREELQQELHSPEAAELPAADREFFEALLTDEELLAQFIFPNVTPKN